MTALRGAAVLAAFAAVSASPVPAEVLRSSDQGFAVSGSETIGSSPAEVWQAIGQPANWWSAEHSWSGDATNFSLELRAGGCFCEALPGGGSVEHMRVINAAPGKLLRMVGSLGPLQSESLTGVLTVSLEPAGKGTRLTWTYKVSGASDIPLSGIAAAVDAVVGEQFHRLAVGQSRSGF